MSFKPYLLVGAVVLAACEAETFTPLGPTGIEVVHGPPSHVSLGTELDTLLQVRVVDADGHPRADVPVTWRITAGDGELIPASEKTDADGLASARWKFGMIPGSKQAQVEIPGVDPLTLRTEAHGFQAVAVTAGWSHGCGIDASQTTWCWGGDEYMRGDAADTGYTLRPTVVSGDHLFVEIHAEDQFTCGRTAGGEIWCWGWNWGGALGQGPAVTTNARLPGVVPGLPPMRSFSVGGDAGCGVASDSTAWCWGDDRSGKAGGVAASVGATPLATPLRFSQIAVSSDHACGLATDGETYCWGSNGAGALGDTGVARNAPTTAIPGGHAFVELVPADLATCGRDASGAVWCWGFGLGVPGMPRASVNPTPVQVILGAPVGAIAGGDGWVAGIGIDGRPYFAHSFGGSLLYEPFDALGLAQIAGQESFCGIARTGEVYCSGEVVDQISCSSLPPWGCAPTGPIPLPVGGRVYGYPPFGD